MVKRLTPEAEIVFDKAQAIEESGIQSLDDFTTTLVPLTLEAKAVFTKAKALREWGMKKLYYSIHMEDKRQLSVHRGDVYFVHLGENIGSEENKTRPVVVVEASTYSVKSPVFIGAIITSSALSMPDIQIPIQGIYFYQERDGTQKQLHGVINVAQLRTFGKERIMGRKVCTLSKAEMSEVNQRLLNIFGLAGIMTSKDREILSLKGKVKYLQDQLDKTQN